LLIGLLAAKCNLWEGQCLQSAGVAYALLRAVSRLISTPVSVKEITLGMSVCEMARLFHDEPKCRIIKMADPLLAVRRWSMI
jgi:hypothetical protein